MTHLFLVTEGFPNGIDNFFDSIRKHCCYTLHNSSEQEKGKSAGVTVREIRFWDITVKQETKKQFLGEIKKHTKTMSEFEVEKLRSFGKAHGVDGRGFKIGMFRKMFHYVLKQLNLQPIDMKQYENIDNENLDKAIMKTGRHGYIMVLGELPDCFEPNGREHS
jgi:hypothetical protein